MTLLKSGRPSSNKAVTIAELINQKEITKVSFNIDKGLYKDIKRFALEKEMQLTQLILTALQEYMKK